MNRMLNFTSRLGFAFIFGSALAAAQATSPPRSVEPSARPADVASPEAIIQSVYAVISGPLGAPRDWARLRSLVTPGAIFAVTATGTSGALRTHVLSVDEFISGLNKAFATMGFYEHGVVSPIWRYAHIAAASSPYESRHAPGEMPYQRGINTFQLSYDGSRWWIVSVAWEGETPAFPLPPGADAMLRDK
jgi:hypothetical protein